jgi:hypothetical protein
VGSLSPVVLGLAALGTAGLLALLARVRFGLLGEDDGPADNGLD